MARRPPPEYGPHRTIYNRFVRWSRMGVFNKIFAAMASKGGKPARIMIDATHLKAHRIAASLKKGPVPDVSGAKHQPVISMSAAIGCGLGWPSARSDRGEHCRELWQRDQRNKLSRSSNVFKPINYMPNRWYGFARFTGCRLHDEQCRGICARPALPRKPVCSPDPIAAQSRLPNCSHGSGEKCPNGSGRLNRRLQS